MRERQRISPSAYAWLFQNRRFSEHALTLVCMHVCCPSRVLADICMFFYPINSVNIQLIHAKEQPPQVHRTILDRTVCGAQEWVCRMPAVPSCLLCWSGATERNFICFCYIILLNESLYAIKIKVLKGGVHSKAIEEPFWVPKRTFQLTVLIEPVCIGVKNILII